MTSFGQAMDGRTLLVSFPGRIVPNLQSGCRLPGHDERPDMREGYIGWVPRGGNMQAC